MPQTTQDRADLSENLSAGNSVVNGTSDRSALQRQLAGGFDGTQATSTGAGGNLAPPVVRPYEPVLRVLHGQIQPPELSHTYSRERESFDYQAAERAHHQWTQHFLAEFIRAHSQDRQKLALALVDPAFRNIVDHPALMYLTGQERRQMAEIAYKIYPENLSPLAEMLSAPRYRSFLVHRPDLDYRGATLLQNFYDLSVKDKLVSVLEPNRNKIIADLIYEINSPGAIVQSNRGTCPAAVLQYFLAQNFPSEYARLMRGLLSTSGQAVMLSGSTLSRAPGTPIADSSNRSTSGRIFQSAIMDWANGPDTLYVNSIDAHIDQATGADLGSGLNTTQLKNICEAIFNVPHYCLEIGFSPYPRDPIALKNAEQIIVETLAANRTISSFDHPRGLVAGLLWGTGEKHNFHAVNVINGADQSRVYFRNPWGPCPDPPLTLYNDPPRRLEDPASGIYSMSKHDFYQRLGFLITANVLAGSNGTY
jgi:hypothetical protein